MKKEDIPIKLKILIVGNSGVGKSSLLLRLTDDKFYPMRATLGSDLKLTTLSVDGTEAKLALWDTAGQEMFRALTRSFYRGAHGLILVYDVNNRKSFEGLDRWLMDLAVYSTTNSVKMVIGNKIDMNEREVTKNQGLRFAEMHNMLFTEYSAKTNEGDQWPLKELTGQIIKTPGLWESDTKSEKVKLGDESRAVDETGCCVTFSFYFWTRR